MAYVTFYAALRALINLLIDNTNTLLLIVFTLEWPASMCGSMAQEDVGQNLITATHSIVITCLL